MRKDIFSLRHFTFVLLLVFATISSSHLCPMYAQTQLTNIPTMRIETFDGKGITSKTDYKLARISVTDSTGVVYYDSVSIRGRGNSSWDRMGSKRPYRLKFQKKEKLLGKGYAKAKSWVLLANADDKTLIRNAVTFLMSERVGQKVVPAVRFVDLYLNNTFMGNYMLTDRVDVRPHRVDITEQDTVVTDPNTDISGGYLLEIDGFTDSEATYFHTKKNLNVRIHSPEEEVINDRQYSYIQNYVQTFEDRIFQQPIGDYMSMVDSTSFISWYLANEIAANLDAWWSIYFYKERGDDLLYWGPLWDEDLGYNNTTRAGDVSTSLMSEVGFGKSQGKIWMQQLKNDEWFRRATADAYEKIYNEGLTDFMLHVVDSLVDELRESAEQNFNVWSINTKVYEEINLFNTYDEYIDCLKSFIRKHNDYLLSEFNSRRPGEPQEPFSLSPNKYYRIHSSGNENFVIDLTDGEITEGHAVCLNLKDDDALSQQWRPVILKEGLYQFVNRQGEMALCDYTDSNPYSYSLVLYPINGNDERQQWYLSDQRANDAFNIYSVTTGKHINNRGGRYNVGNEVVCYASSDKDATSQNRLWIFEEFADVENEPDTTATAILSAQRPDYALRYVPAAGRLRFASAQPETLTFNVQVVSLSGQVVRSFEAREGCSVAELPNAPYIVTWTEGGVRRSVKFIKE